MKRSQYRETTIENFDLNEEYFSAFLNSLNRKESANRSDVPIKRRIHTCLKIERIDKRIDLKKSKKIKESTEECNVIIAIDINDETTDREPKILKENGPITVIEVCMTSTEEMMTDTKLIEDIIKHPEKQIEEILQEWRQWRQEKIDQEKKSGYFYRLGGFFTSIMPWSDHHQQKMMDISKQLRRYETKSKVLLEETDNIKKEIKRGEKLENMNEKYQLHVQQLENMITQHEEKVKYMKGKQESHVEELQNLVMEHIKEIEKMQREQELYVQELKNIEKEHKEKLELHLEQSQNTKMEHQENLECENEVDKNAK